MTITKALLESLCGPEDRASVGKPFSVRIDDVWWNGTTNGHALLLVRGDIGGFKVGAFKREGSPPVEGLMRKGPPTHKARFSLLAKWCDNCEKWEQCKACKGAGKHVCDFCEIVDGSICPECEGDKGFWNQHQVDHEIWSFNRVVAARYLMPFADTVGDVDMWLGGELEPIEFRAPEWRVLLMPMRRDEGNVGTTGTVPEGLIRRAQR